MIYVQEEHHLFRAKTYKGLVGKLLATSFDETAKDKKGFMFNVKARVKELHDKHVRAGNYKQFILDLDRLGLIRLFRCIDCDHNTGTKCRKSIKMRPDRIQCPLMDNKLIRAMNRP